MNDVKTEDAKPKKKNEGERMQIVGNQPALSRYQMNFQEIIQNIAAVITPKEEAPVLSIGRFKALQCGNADGSSFMQNRRKALKKRTRRKMKMSAR